MSKVQELDFSVKHIPQRLAELKEDFWGDLKTETQRALKRLLEASMEIDVQDLIGRRHWEHSYSNNMPYYRNGYRYRGLLTSYGYLSRIKVPRLREGKLQFRCFPRYRQRCQDVDRTILEMFLAGVSTRRVKEVLAPVLGPNTVSSTSVSNISKILNQHVNKFHLRQLNDDYMYLLLDGIFLNTKNPIYKARRCVLVAYGIKTNGIRELIDFRMAPHGESQNAWETFLNNLFNRGVQGQNLKLIGHDGNKGLYKAIDLVFPNALHQPCWAHKLRNVSNKLPKKIQPLCISEAREIYKAESRTQALHIFKDWVKLWKPIAPTAVDCLSKDIEQLLNFFYQPRNLWIKLRTTNIIERSFREVRRRTRPMSCLQNSDSLQRIVFAVFHRLNNNWKGKPLKITHNS